MTPNYLSNYIPQLVSETNPYHRRNPLERIMPRCRTESYQQSFFPSTTVLWNALPDYIKLSNSLAEFKRHLRSDDTIVPPFYYSTNRMSEIIHCKIRLEISDLNSDLFKRHLTNNMSCMCGFRQENALHYLYHCPLFNNSRRNTLNQIPNFQQLNLKSLTHGDPNLSLVENKEIFEKVNQFISSSLRFKK